MGLINIYARTISMSRAYPKNGIQQMAQTSVGVDTSRKKGRKGIENMTQWEKEKWKK